MKLIILEDVAGMSKHTHPFFEKKGIEYVVVNGSAEASEEYVKGQSVFLHYTNSSCSVWEQCNDFLYEYEDLVPHIHIHSGGECEKHLPKIGKGVKHLRYLGDMEELYTQIQLCLEELSRDSSKTYLEECLVFENAFTSSSISGAGTKLCKWVHKKWECGQNFFVDQEDLEYFLDRENVSYIDKRGEPEARLFIHSNEKTSEEQYTNIVENLKKFIVSGKINEGSEFYIYDLRSNGEVLGYLLFDRKADLSFTKDELFFYALNRFPRVLLEKKHFQRILDESYRDDVTNLYNQKYLPVITENLIEESKANDQSFSVLFIDVDFFKKVNDTKGHMVGSGILCELGEILQKNIREDDYPFRYGGDEFLLLLSNTDSEGAAQIAERIRAQVEAHEFSIGEHKINITLSIGIASYPEHATTKEDVIELADQAMYYGKNKSRNIVFVAS